MSCVVDVASSISPQPGMEEIPLLCSESGKMLECVRVAREACPTMELLADEAFAHAISVAWTEYDKYCEEAMSKDGPVNCDVSPWSSMPECQTATSTTGAGTSCNYNPIEALGHCNTYMAGVTPGDLEAMCGMGDVFLDCLTQILRDCPNHHDLLAFDLETGISTTRYMLATQCPKVTKNCAEELERANQQCAYVTASQGNGVYCRSLEEYTSCIENARAVCPRMVMTADYITTNYEFHCGPSSVSVTGGCPDDLAAELVMRCYPELPDVSDMKTYCSKTKAYVSCIDGVVGGCQNDSRATVIGLLNTVDFMRQQIPETCAGNNGAS